MVRACPLRELNSYTFLSQLSSSTYNKVSLSYECSLEESKAFLSKSQTNKNKDNIKKDEFDLKLIITELFL